MSDGLQVSQLSSLLVEDAVRAALREDLGRAGDLTSDAITNPGDETSALIRTRARGCIAGMQLAEATFRALDSQVSFDVVVSDGTVADPGAIIAEVRGPARAILTGERTALNFLIHLSGIATLTHTYVDAVAGTSAHICCTRKTTPGLRALEKYAVRVGGGMNHRFGLDDAILIKDNHIAFAGDIATAIERVRARAGHMVKVEVEVDTLAQLETVLGFDVDAVLLDNMTPDHLKAAVRLAGGRVITEASGGVSLETVRAIAEAGVNLISVGALTHSAPALDLGLDLA